MIARTTWGRALAVWMSIGLTQVAAPAVYAATPAPDASNGHIVDSSQVVRRLLDSAKTRDEKVKLFQDALATKDARAQARARGVDPDRLRAAVPHLTDAELAELSARALQVKDVAAGHHHDDEGALIVLGVLLLVAGIAIIAATAHDHGYWDDDCGCW